MTFILRTGEVLMQKTNTNYLIAATLIMAALMPQAAYAQLAPVDTAAQTILDFMTGVFATTAGAIAIAVIGYRWFTGRMEMGKALTIVAGIVLVLGAVQVVSFISAGVGGAP